MHELWLACHGFPLLVHWLVRICRRLYFVCRVLFVVSCKVFLKNTGFHRNLSVYTYATTPLPPLHAPLTSKTKAYCRQLTRLINHTCVIYYPTCWNNLTRCGHTNSPLHCWLFALTDRRESETFGSSTTFPGIATETLYFIRLISLLFVILLFGLAVSS